MRRAALIALSLSACYPPSILTPDGREQVVRATSRQPRYLRVAVYAGPFFGDGSRVLLTDRPAAEVSAFEGPDGRRVEPPPPERILPPGTPIFVDLVEFPTGAVLWGRPLATPRYQPWLLGRAAGEDRGVVLVLSGQSGSAEDLLAQVARVLTPDDPSPVYRALPETQRAAIRHKELVEGMDRDAAFMAWGSPDRIAVERPSGAEEWSWSAGRRKALFQDDRVVRFDLKAAALPAR